ncbi:MAG: alpha/beta fold hydrolase [Proteobacteria bacterium]|nr:alpha/beta fold hydrolase [Pseudomonadota bacterium]
MAASLVLLPGLDGSGEQFAPLLAALGGALEVSIARYPGQGEVDFAAHEASARAAIPAGRAFVLLGESFSGPIAIRLAASAPPGLTGLILCASFARFPRPRLHFLRPLAGLVSAAPLLPLWAAASVLLGGSAAASLPERWSTSLRQVSPRALRARIESVFDVDARAELARVAVPVLYLRGRRDRLVPRAAGSEVTRLARRSTLAELDAPHFVLQSRPGEAARLIREFLAACGA